MMSSSPSSIHIGHYLAALREPSFVSFYSTYWTDILRFKVPPDRWFVGLQVSLLKEPGNFAVGRLRFIQLYEADFSSLDKWLAHKITSTLTELLILSRPEGHFAKKECTVYSGCKYGQDIDIRSFSGISCPDDKCFSGLANFPP